MKKYKYLFISVLAIYICLAEANGQAVATHNPVCLTDANWTNLPSHPRLFANDKRIAGLKLQTDKVSKDLLQFIKSEAEKYVNAPKIVYPTQGFKMGAMRDVQGRILSLGLSYRVFGDKRYLDRAKAELMQLAELPDWCPSHFLDVGEGALAAAIGLDWLFNDLTPAEREKVVQAIIKNAIEPSLGVKESDNNTSWLNGNFNWNPVCNGGLMAAALAIYEYEPKLSRMVVDRAIKYIPFAGEAYTPDGSNPEGPSYWSYGTSFYVIAIEAIRSVFGTGCDLEKVPGFLKTGDYNIQVVGPTGNDYNYSDYHAENLNEPVMLWFGRELNRPDLIQEELNDLSRLNEKLNTGKNEKPGKNVVPSRHIPLEIFWWETSLQNAVSSKAPLQYTAKGGLPLGIMRSAWGDPNASFIAIKGGTPNNSHGHMDVGSFILEADGIRWAIDLGTESYGKMREAKLNLWDYSQNSNRWTTFRCGPEAHNILRFNNQRQDITGNGEISELPVEQGTMGNILNLSSLYKSQVNSVNRTVKLLSNNTITIQDDWETGEKSVEAEFQWLTKAKATIQPYGVLLQQEGKSLKLTVEMPGSNIKPEIVVEDVSQAKATQDSDNPGVSRVVIKLKTPANSHGKLLVKAIPQH